MTAADVTDIGAEIAALGDGDEIEVRLDLEYRRAVPCVLRVRRRADRFDIDDRGMAIELAGRPDGWLRRAEALAAVDGFNVNRRGVLFVQGRTGRDVGDLCERLGELSLAVFAELLEDDSS